MIRIDETDIGVNISFQQLHLPRRGLIHYFYRVACLAMPGIPTIKTRLKRPPGLKKFKDALYRYMEVNKNAGLVTSPFGTIFCLRQAREIPFGKPLGLSYMGI